MGKVRRRAGGGIAVTRLGRSLTLAHPSPQAKSILIKLVSAAGTGYFYATRKNPTNVPHKLALMKYDPVVRQHVLFTEAKMPKGRGGRRAGKK